MKFLILFRAIHNEFRLSELYAVVSRLRGCSEKKSMSDMNIVAAVSEITLPKGWNQGKAGDIVHGDIFCYVHLRSLREAHEVARQCVLIRALLVPLGHGYDYESCIASLDSPAVESECAQFFHAERQLSFKCVVEAFGRSYSMAEQLTRMERFKELFDRFPGPVQMKRPDGEFWIMEDAFPSLGHDMNEPISEPRQVFLGRLVALGAANLGHRFHLKRRRFLGPTSTNAELAFVMANMAKVSRGSLVLDPFCGTGSILVSCAELGATVIGADLDILVLRRKGRRAMDTNFEQYGLEKPVGVLRADMLRSPFRTGRPWVDAIVCDPPYGLREGARGFRDDGNIPRSEAYIPGTERVRFVDLLDGLLRFAAEHLVTGGRLVYWLPTTPEYSDADLPRHPGFELVSNCNQMLTMRMHRRLITMSRLSREEEIAAQQAQKVTNTGGNMCAVPPTQTCKVSHVPAHDDFSAKLLRQPRRSEANIKPRNAPVLL